MQMIGRLPRSSCPLAGVIPNRGSVAASRLLLNCGVLRTYVECKYGVHRCQRFPPSLLGFPLFGVDSPHRAGVFLCWQRLPLAGDIQKIAFPAYITQIVELSDRPVVLSPGYFHFIREQATRDRDEPQCGRRHDDRIDQPRDSKVWALQDVKCDCPGQRQVLDADFERDRDNLRHWQSESFCDAITEAHGK